MAYCRVGRQPSCRMVCGQPSVTSASRRWCARGGSSIRQELAGVVAVVVYKELPSEVWSVRNRVA
eukprot:6956071-Pyramimonas_sp.AAC.2